jgi:MICOS complex subunit MIC26
LAPDESLTPAVLYVSVALLSGSILSRNRSIFTRGLLPTTFLYLSVNHFLPKTMTNVSAYAGSLEEMHFPILAQKHAVAIAHTRMTWEHLREAGVNGHDKFQVGLGSALRKVQDETGLKVQEALGRGIITSSKEVVEKAKEASQPIGGVTVETAPPGEKALEEETMRLV